MLTTVKTVKIPLSELEDMIRTHIRQKYQSPISMKAEIAFISEPGKYATVMEVLVKDVHENDGKNVVMPRG